MGNISWEKLKKELGLTMTASRKKRSRSIGKRSSKTPSAALPIDGPGVVLPSDSPLLQEDSAYVQTARRQFQEKNASSTISNPSLIRCKVLKDGTSIHNGFCVATGGSKCCVSGAMPLKLKEKMIFEEMCECDPSKEHYCLESPLSPEQKAKEALGVKFDDGVDKPPLAYIPKAALWAEGQAFAHGAKKYDPWNYKNGIAVSRTVSAALRHIAQFLEGEDCDQESGAHHLGSARANLAMALDTLANHAELDDRFKGEKK
jgi:hypothetical protein